MKQIKTNAMRELDQAKLTYITKEYAHGKEAVEGNVVASLLNQDPDSVFKTLVVQAPSKQYYVFMVGVDHELDLKACAKAVNEKSVEMIPVKEINKVTGYIRGGCSPLAMKKHYPTCIDEACLNHEMIYFSAGKIGLQIGMDPKDLISLKQIKVAKIARKD